MADHLDSSDNGPFVLDNDGEYKSTRGNKDKTTNSNAGSNAANESKESKLAHVPCKFYKAGACSAGQSCPFSHTAIDRGGPKETCQWFIKGNCKFGHKCALAHLLPGQPIAMDRKNKKAAQLANQSGGHGAQNQAQGGGGGFDNMKEKKRRPPNGRDNRPTKAQGNLTATAPNAESQASPSTPTKAPQLQQEQPTSPLAPTQQPQEVPTSPLPTTQQTQPTSGMDYRPPITKRFSSGRNGSSDLGYGPIGSPPNATHMTGVGMRSPFTPHANHFSPGTSPRDHSIQPSTSPYAHHAEPQFFGVNSYARAAGGATTTTNANSGGVAGNTTGGNTGTESTQPTGIAIQSSRNAWRPPKPNGERGNENAVSDNSDDFEEFLPSSLNDLLTPEERQRRASRSGGQRLGLVGEPIGIGGSIGGGGIGGNGGVGSFGAGHRYSRSVPAARLLETAGMWKDTEHPNDSLSVASLSYRSAGLASDGAGFSPSGFQLATSNASGAFLHHNPRGTQAGGAGAGHFSRGGGGSVTVNTSHLTSHLTRQILSQSYEESDVVNAMPTPTALTSRGGFGSGFNAPARYDPYAMQGAGRAGGLGGLGADMMSPSSKALQSHAPGQSLPQGLAAGLSRLHLVPGTGGISGGLSNGINSKLANEGGKTVGGGVRSPLRSQFGMGTPDESKFGLAALSSSPGMRTSWGQQPSLSGLSQHASQQQQQSQAQQSLSQMHQQSQQSLLSQSLSGQLLHSQGAYAFGGEGLQSSPVVSAPIPVRAGMGGIGGIAGLVARGGDTEDELFALDD